ncbi:MAG TPA: hypothetical protein VFC00_25295, partial [Micromonosporaceae bacterium]|nr:hypothetical protein [Micromonosporaceae bacterium]
RATTQPCDGRFTVPTQVTATAVSPSSVRVGWVQIADALSFTVFRTSGYPQPTVPVATVATNAAMITGLPSASTNRFSVVAQLAGCGSSGPSAQATATTLAGPGARPLAPTDVRVTTRPVNGTTGVVTLQWTQPPSADPAVSYRLYEGATVLATSSTTTVTLTLPGGPAHTVAVVGVDRAGNESRASQPVTFVVPFIPPP